MQKHQTSLEKIERKKDDAVFLVCEFTKSAVKIRPCARFAPLCARAVLYGSRRASPSRLTPDGFTGAARQALDERGAEGEPTEAESAL